MPTAVAHEAFRLSDDDRRLLEQVRDSGTEQVRRVERARIILAYAEGLPVARIAELVAVSVNTVY